MKRRRTSIPPDEPINVIRSERIDLRFLTGLLNSSVVRFWLRHRGKMQGNNFQLDKEPLLSIPIFVPTNPELERISKLVLRAAECQQQLSQTRSAADSERLTRLFEQTDSDVCRAIENLYGISDEERQLLLTG